MVNIIMKQSQCLDFSVPLAITGPCSTRVDATNLTQTLVNFGRKSTKFVHIETIQIHFCMMQAIHYCECSR
jgi:hypothetical protein